MFSVPGQPSITVNGDRVNAACAAALGRARTGDLISISEVRTKIIGEGSGILTKAAAPAVFEIQ